MGLFKSIFNLTSSINNAKSQNNTVKNSRKAIFELRDKLRNTPQFSKIFYTLIEDPAHPPRNIEASQNGSFWSEAWDAEMQNYEPYTTEKLNDSNIGYYEGCAVYLLIQECYPNVYDFPSNSLQDLQNGATIKLVMKKEFIGKAIKPASEPKKYAASAVQQPSSAGAAFCSGCGKPVSSDTAFCPSCGKKLK